MKSATQTKQRTSQEQPDPQSREHADAQVKIKSRAQPDPKTPKEAQGRDVPKNGPKNGDNTSPDARAGNDTKPMDDAPTRRDAADEQAALQNNGPDSLPAPGYPVRRAPAAANPQDRQRR